jgi:hypothetical protein
MNGLKRTAATRAVVGSVAIILGGWLLVSCDDSPVAADSANPEVVFDGTSCAYDGPTEIIEGDLAFTLNNEGSIPISVVLFHFDDRTAFETELDHLAVGLDTELTGGELPVGGTLNTINTVQSGSSVRSLEALKTAQHIVDCVHTP